MARRSVFRVLWEQKWAKVFPVVNANLKGKTIIVVGANTGIGFEAAQHFARMDAGRLILACRSQEKGEAAIKRRTKGLEQATGYSKAELWIVDLADFASVKSFVDRALKDLERLDILMLNAAIASPKYAATKDGWETGLQVNDLSLSLLALLLLPRMLETARQYNTIPRIVVVSSGVHYFAQLEDKVFASPNALEVLGSKEYCTPQIMASRYVDSKLLNVFFTRALSNHLKDQPVIVNTVDPGFCYSELRRDITNLFYWVLEKLVAQTAEEGSRQLIWAAVGFPGGKESSLDEFRGAFISLTNIYEPADFVLGEEGKKRENKLWNDLISTLERVDSRVKDVVARHLTAH